MPSQAPAPDLKDIKDLKESLWESSENIESIAQSIAKSRKDVKGLSCLPETARDGAGPQRRPPKLLADTSHSDTWYLNLTIVILIYDNLWY